MKKKLLIITIIYIALIGGYSFMRYTNPLNIGIKPLRLWDIKQQESGKRVEFLFNYNKQSTIASNQFAIWIETIDGEYVKTLYVTEYTALDGYRRRPESISGWVSGSRRSSMAWSEIDTISGATPKSGRYTVSWDFTDNHGNSVTGGEYRYFVEGTMFYGDYVLYSGIISVGDEGWEESPIPEYTKPDSEYQSMIVNVIVQYYPR